MKPWANFHEVPIQREGRYSFWNTFQTKVSFKWYRPTPIWTPIQRLLDHRVLREKNLSSSLQEFPPINCGFGISVGETKTQTLQRLPFSEFLFLDPLLMWEAGEFSNVEANFSNEHKNHNGNTALLQPELELTLEFVCVWTPRLLADANPHDGLSLGSGAVLAAVPSTGAAVPSWMARGRSAKAGCLLRTQRRALPCADVGLQT